MDVTRSLEWEGVAGRSLRAARVVVLVAFLDLFIQFPIVAPYAERLGASATMVGVIVGVYSVTNLVGNVLAGMAIDRWGRRTPVLGGLLVTMLALLSYALARNPGHLVGARAVHGLAAAVLTPGAFAMIGDVAAEDRRARAMGISGAIIAVTAMIGPPVAGVMRDRVGFGAVFVGGALLMLVALAVFWLWGKETATPSGGVGEGGSGIGLVTLLLRPRLVAAYLTVFALTIGLGTLVTHLPLVMERAGASSARSGLAFTVFATVALVAMVSPLTRLSDRRGRSGPLAAGLLLIGGGLAVLGFLGGVSGATLGMGVFGLGFGLVFPSSTALVVEGTERDDRGTAFGVFYAIYSLGVVVGAVLSGVVSEWQGEITGLPFLVSAPVALLVVPAVLLWARRPRSVAAPR